MRCMDRDPARRPTSAELVDALEAMRPLCSEGPRRVQTAPPDTRPRVVSISAMSRQRATVDFPGVEPGPKPRPSPVPEQASVQEGLPDQAARPGGASPDVVSSSSAGAVLSSMSTAERTSEDRDEAQAAISPAGTGSPGSGGRTTVATESSQAPLGSPFWLDRALPSPFEAAQEGGTLPEVAGNPDARPDDPKRHPAAVAPPVSMIPSPFLAMADTEDRPATVTVGAPDAVGAPFEHRWDLGGAAYPKSPFDFAESGHAEDAGTSGNPAGHPERQRPGSSGEEGSGGDDDGNRGNASSGTQVTSGERGSSQDVCLGSDGGGTGSHGSGSGAHVTAVGSGGMPTKRAVPVSPYAAQADLDW
jgi:hypothetical protein